MRKRWLLKKADRGVRNLLVRELEISPIVAQLLANRSIIDPEEAHKFLSCELSNLHDPYLLKGMIEAVSRIRRALSKGEKILLYGDYDVDGITSVALLRSVLSGLGGNVLEYIPNRIEEGYGLNLDACRFAHKKRINLIVTVDCGINALREVDYLNSLGIDTIIVDHHEVQVDGLPKAYAIINPLQKDCSYPFKHLAGVGLAFKLAQALLDQPLEKIKYLLDLVALGTVSDIVPQLDENRILTKHGLEVLNERKRIGLKELIRVSGLGGRDISSGHIGYMLGPRINASGRIGSPKIALGLLVTNRWDEAKESAQILDRENRNRQRIESRILKEAMQKVQREVNFKEHKTIVLSGSDWHPGVIGIVASRLVDKFYRPTAIISLNRNAGRGSARSISDFNLFGALSECKKYLEEFGGHKAACGFSIQKKDIDKFKSLFNKIANERLLPEHLLPKLQADMDIPLNSLSETLIYDIDRLAPHGPKNPFPVFISRGIKLKNAPRAIGRKGMKFWVTDGKITCEAVAFGLSDGFFDVLKDEAFDVAYFPSVNTYKGVRSIKLDLEDLRTSPVRPQGSNGASEGIL
ncbi:MAG: single-stranded-DNA-specific exonuclease RecJ [Candidatus Omnitrophica bacterium]|nr:single-stranded-DNA-specific exonuclease RecJ [Candidatus Omnitrophota bacterium]